MTLQKISQEARENVPHSLWSRFSHSRGKSLWHHVLGQELGSGVV